MATGPSATEPQGHPNREEPPPDLEGELKKREETLIAHLRKIHTQWDKTKREWQATIGQSKNHPNTRGCSLEEDLVAELKFGEDLDKSMLQAETKVLGHERLTDAEIIKAQVLAGDLQNHIKTHNKKANTVKDMLKLPVRSG